MGRIYLPTQAYQMQGLQVHISVEGVCASVRSSVSLSLTCYVINDFSRRSDKDVVTTTVKSLITVVR